MLRCIPTPTIEVVPKAAAESAVLGVGDVDVPIACKPHPDVVAESALTGFKSALGDVAWCCGHEAGEGEGNDGNGGADCERVRGTSMNATGYLKVGDLKPVLVLRTLKSRV